MSEEKSENLWVTLAKNLMGIAAVAVVMYMQDQTFRLRADEALEWIRKRDRAWRAAFRAARPAWLQVMEDTPAVIAEAETYAKEAAK